MAENRYIPRFLADPTQVVGEIRARYHARQVLKDPDVQNALKIAPDHIDQLRQHLAIRMLTVWARQDRYYANGYRQMQQRFGTMRNFSDTVTGVIKEVEKHERRATSLSAAARHLRSHAGDSPEKVVNLAYMIGDQYIKIEQWNGPKKERMSALSRSIRRMQQEQSPKTPQSRKQVPQRPAPFFRIPETALFTR